MELSVKINAAIDGFVSAMKQANNEMQKLVSSTGKPVAVNADTTQAVAGIKNVGEEVNKFAGLYIDKMGKVRDETGRFAAGFSAVGGVIKETGAAADTTFGNLKKSFQEGREQANSGGGIFGGIAGQLGQLATPMGAATAGIGLLTAGLAASFTLGQEFETNLKSVSAVTGVTGAALEDIGNRAQNLAGKFGGSASDQLGVFQTALSKIGPQLAQDGESLNTFADNVNTLSKTDSALGAAGAVDALSGAMLQFGVNVNDTKEVARESSRFIQVLAASAGVGSASVSDVAASIANVGGTAKNANISFEELNAALQVQASKSIVGSAAGTGLTAVINKLQAASGPAADQLKTMGTSSEKLGKILTTQGIGAAMTELRGAMEKLGSTSEKNAFLVSMFGETGLNTAAALLGGGDMLKEFTKGVTGTQAATEQAAVNMDTLAQKMSRAKSALENVFINIYRFIEPILVNIIDAISTAFDSIYNIIAPVFVGIGNLLKAGLDAVLPVFEGLKNAVINTFNSFGGLQGILNGVSQALQVVAAVGAGVAAYFIVMNASVIANTVATTANTVANNAAAVATRAITAVKAIWTTVTSGSTYATIASTVATSAATAATWLFNAAQVALNAVMAISPLGWLAIGVAALVAGIVYAYNHFESFRNVINNVWEKIKSFGLAVLNIVSYMNPFTAAFRLAYDKIKPFKDFIDGLVNTIKNVGSAIGDFFSSIGSAVGDAFSGGVNDGLDKIDSKGAAGKLEKDMKGAIAEVKLALNTLTLGKIFDDAKSGADSAKTAAINQASGVQFAFEKLAKAQKGNEKERLDALEAFKTASGATSIETYEQAKKIADKARADLAKTQKENLDKSRELKKIESANSIEDGEKENQKRITNDAKAAKLRLDAEKFNAEKTAKSRLATEEELQLQTLEIQKKTDAANFDVKIKEAKRQAAAVAETATAQEKRTSKLNIEQLEFDKLKSAYDTEQKINEIKGKAALKAFDDAQKRQADFAKTEIESAKTNAEKIALIEGGGLKTVIAQNEAKRRLIDLQNEYEIEQTIEKNAAVIKANEILKKAISSGDTAKIDTASAAVLTAINQAERTDAAVLAVKQKNAIELQKVDKENAARLADFRISLIEDDADRERAEREAAIQKTFAAELLAAAGNERLILDAHRKANAARYDSDEEYNRKTTDLATRTANTLQNLGMGIADGIAEMYGNTFNDLSKAFDDYAAGVQKKLEGTSAEDTKKLEDETKTLRSQLAKREISYQDFQEKIAAIREKGEGGGAASATERANLAIGKSFGVMAKNATAGVEASLEEMKKLSKGTAQAIKEKGLSDKNVAKDFERFGKDIVSVGEGTAESVIGIFGQMAAAGTLTLKSAANAALGITIDTISKIVMAQAPAILAIFTGTIPPPFGFIAGLAAIGAVQLLLATAKGAIGADQGVVGIDGSYSTPRSSRDTIPIWVRDGESIINPEATAQNRALLKFINSTNRPASEFFSNSVVTASGNLQLAHSNQIRTAQLVTAGNSPNSQDFGAMQNSLANIERSLANAKILETRSKHTSAVQLTVTENRAYKIQQEKAALKLERARK